MTTLDKVYDRTDPTKDYEKHLFVAGRILQSAELNEIQTQMLNRISAVSNVLFKDGDVVRDASIVVDTDTGAVRCLPGAVYLAGAIRGAPAATITIPLNDTVPVGLYLRKTVVTEVEDKSLRDPAMGSGTYGQPGALRQKIETAWGYAGDGQSGEFYPIYTVENGLLRAKEAPPNLDAVTQALARYDRDSAGGSYAVSGLSVVKQADVGGKQVYTVAEGRARVNGFGVEMSTSRRVTYDAAPDLRFVDSEPHVSATASAQRIAFDLTPAASIDSVHITQRKTATITHGGFTGAADALPDTSIVSIVAVNQGGAVNANGDGFTGGTTYTAGDAYKLTAGKVDWSLAGPEVAVNSTYQVIYTCIATTTPTAVDAAGFTVTGAVQGTQILVSYSQMLPRVDTLCMDATGGLVWIKGVASASRPQKPTIPPSLLPLASVYQSWDAGRYVINDGLRVVPMQDIAQLHDRVDALTALVAQQSLRTDAANRDAGVKKGVFVDPFLNDSMRDQGAPQTAAIFAGMLTLPVVATAKSVSADVAVATTLPYTLEPVLSQAARTGSMLVNPYMAFDPIPAKVTLTPAIDRWTEVASTWASSITQRITTGSGVLQMSTTTTATQTTTTSTSASENLRPITVKFSIDGFGPNEELASVTFDGITVTPSA